MLTIQSSRGQQACDRVRRRDFLSIGALGLAGCSLADLLAARSFAAAVKSNFVRDKSVVLLYLSGGASHIERSIPR